MQPLLDPPQVWTFADLQALPEDVDWRRYEIVDGALVVSPSVNLRHEVVSENVRAALRAAGTPDFVVVGPMAVGLHPSYRIPDLIVVSAEVGATDINPVPATDVLLAVEVVSPGSATTDRITKPAQYAAAGIASYWRVETTPEISLTVYELPRGTDVYIELGTWSRGQIARLQKPFAVEIAIDALTPPPSS